MTSAPFEIETSISSFFTPGSPASMTVSLSLSRTSIRGNVPILSNMYSRRTGTSFLRQFHGSSSLIFIRTFLLSRCNVVCQTHEKQKQQRSQEQSQTVHQNSHHHSDLPHECSLKTALSLARTE